MFSCENCETFKNNFFYRTPSVAPCPSTAPWETPWPNFFHELNVRLIFVYAICYLSNYEEGETIILEAIRMTLSSQKVVIKRLKCFW